MDFFSKVQIFTVFFNYSDSTWLDGILSSDAKNKCSQSNKVFYLPSIDKSPTKTSTVYEVLLQVKAKAEKLSNTEADLVLDHVIYYKALLILMELKNIQLKNFINLRMGGFHASCIFIVYLYWEAF